MILALTAISKVNAQTTNDVLNLLVSNKSITPEQADSIRAEAAIKQQETEAGKKSYFINAARQIKMSGFLQTRYQALDEPKKKDGFDIRRARLDLTGRLTPYLSFRMMADLADKPKLLDAYAEVKFNEYLILTAGQFKIPFSLENLTSVKVFELIDFSQAVDAMVARNKDVIGNQNGRDIGIQLGGVLWKKGAKSLLEYRIGVVNGSGINIADTSNEGKDIVGRLILNPFKGFTLGGSYYNGWGKAIKPSSNYKGKSQPRTRFGMDANYAGNRISARAEYIQGTDGETEKAGWYTWVGYYIIRQKLQVIVKYDTFDPDKSGTENVTTNYAIGANLGFNEWSRLQAFYTIRGEEGPSVNNNYFSLQYQIGF